REGALVDHEHELLVVAERAHRAERAWSTGAIEELRIELALRRDQSTVERGDVLHALPDDLEHAGVGFRWSARAALRRRGGEARVVERLPADLRRERDRFFVVRDSPVRVPGRRRRGF